MSDSKVPERILALIQEFLDFRGEVYNRGNEVNILRLLVIFTTQDLADGTAPNPILADENLGWFKKRLDELGAGEVRA